MPDKVMNCTAVNRYSKTMVTNAELAHNLVFVGLSSLELFGSNISSV